MPRLLLEGKSITELLAQVRAEHGDDVTIVAAEKVRSGGVAGFFARESYALTVEVPGPGAPAPAAPGAPSTPLMHEQGVDGTGTNRAQFDRLLMHEQTAATSAPATPAVAAQQPGTLLDLAAAIDAAEAAEQGVVLGTAPMHATVQRPTLSTASPEFQSILSRLTALDAPAPAAAAEPAPAAPVDPYTKLREALTEIAPHLDLSAAVPLVLVIPPAALAAPTAAASVTATPVTAASVPEAATPTPTVPRQGRHRRSAQAAESTASMTAGSSVSDPFST
ncbi:hypothetical protein [Sporichthya polymorpha]|uniref:hypothetical protein n=1 Tax=Sporichthya polymorpha TaxID=35751 RepID=UPI00048BEC77|nr:hypothetical protein [Sporichthya polymorpha]